MDIVVNPFALRELSGKNVILGKNGCGKSFMMKQIEAIIGKRPEYGLVRYISPERGGNLVYEPGIDQAMAQNTEWIRDARRSNQSANFRQQSATLFRRLELLVLREIETEHTKDSYVPRRFQDTIDKINVLLDRVRLERDNAKAFRIVVRETGAEAQPGDISSGESELISLGIEILTFVRESKAGKLNILFVDEPDVHLHPDLQYRLARFMIEVLIDQSVTLVLATHSTALLAGLADDEGTKVAFKRRESSVLTFKRITDVDRAILPIFGAHPLSNVFNQSPILLVEGEDDERVWQQAIRSGKGKIRLFPCVAGSIDQLADYETEVNSLIEAVYDNAKAYSLRDRDTGPEEIEDAGNVIRMRLSCRAAENLMLTNEALACVGTTWKLFQDNIRAWVAVNTTHKYHAEMQRFADAGFDRKSHDLKNIRMILIGLMSTKPWEVLVGQTIAALAKNGGASEEGSIRNFLGVKVCERLLGLPSLANNALAPQA
jgi:energy-coupling factor transporter ATP-binding protein EcfA2